MHWPISYLYDTLVIEVLKQGIIYY